MNKYDKYSLVYKQLLPNFISSLSNLREAITFIIISHNSDSLKGCDSIYKISNKNIQKIR